MSENVENSGYRLTPEKKERLRAAGVRAKLYSLQSIIEKAVDEFLEKYEGITGETGLNSAHEPAQPSQAPLSGDRLQALELTLQEALIEIGAMRGAIPPGKDGGAGNTPPARHPAEAKKGQGRRAR